MDWLTDFFTSIYIIGICAPQIKFYALLLATWGAPISLYLKLSPL